MLQERRARIMDILDNTGVVHVSDLTATFGVSAETIRRDLEALEEKGHLCRIHGGAVPMYNRGVEPAYNKRIVAHFTEKQAIAREALKLVSDGDVIQIDIGTTTLEFAKMLVGNYRITVLTNSLLIAGTLAADERITVIVTGGIVRMGDLSLSGSLSNENMRNFNTDKLFLGAGGIDPKKGVTDYHLGETDFRKIAMGNTQRVIVLADNSKFGVIAMNRVCEVKKIDTLIADSGTDPAVLDEFSALGCHVICAAV
ncbi:MAG: DeoR/GlpR family DNA-binding transcription regulator [Lawsonibacter sp.]